jgi:hypothetical protein
MSRRRLGLLAGVMLSTLAAAPAAPAITVRVEGSTRTLLTKTSVSRSGSPVIKDGNPSHRCAGNTAAGALERATRGNWSGTWFDGLGYQVTTIRGERHPGSPSFFALWVNNRQSSTGVCSTNLRSGDDLLFLVDRCVFDAARGACSNDPVRPLEVRLSRRRADGTVLVTVVSYTVTGRAFPASRASILRNGAWIGKTDARGRLRVRLRARGTTVLRALKRGFARSEPVRTRRGA